MSGVAIEKLVSIIKRAQSKTYHLQSSSAKYPLCSRLYVPSVPLQVPQYVPSAQLREHARDQLDLRRADSGCLTRLGRRATATGGPRGVAGGREEPSHDKHSYQYENGQLRYVYRR
jgi:hypothetical protein